MSKKKIIKIKWNNVIIFLLIIVSTIGLIISITNIIKWKLDSNNTNKQINQFKETTKIEEIEDNNTTKIIEQEEDIPDTNPYWDYIKMNLIDVDIGKLKKINSDTIGWLQVNGTNINYPFVQAKNNEYYLKNDFNKKYNSAGWVFMDYRNNISNLDKNTIIYAHGRLDKTMFGSLKNILTSGWLKNINNYVIKLSTDKENTLWQVFSVYHIPTTSDYLEINFNNNNDFLDFAKMLLNRSAYNFNTSVSKNDNILTLSTCYNDKERVVLHAKLIKSSEKANND